MAEWSVERIEVQSPDPRLAYTANAYLLRSGDDRLLIDAGFAYPASHNRIAERLRAAGGRLRAIALTHHHPDHAGGAPALARAFNAPIFCAPLERAACVRIWETSDLTDDLRITVCANLNDGAVLPDFTPPLECLATPGHTHGHTAFFHRPSGTLFAGDLILSSGTVWIGPPDGHLGDYLDSLDRMAALPPAVVHPGHGAPNNQPADLIRSIKTRRSHRSRDMLIILQQDGPATFDELRDRLYGAALSPGVAWAARKTVQAHAMQLVLQDRAALDYDRARGCLICRAI